MGESQQFCLRWGSYQQQLSEALRSLLDRELLVDVTLACDGRSLRAHRAILSACSDYFQELFQESAHPHPIVILKDVRFDELEALVRFMYHGEVTMSNESLAGFLSTAETLQIRGLTRAVFPSQETIHSKEHSIKEDSNSIDNHDTSVESAHDMARESSPEPKRIKVEHQTPTPSSQLHSSMGPYADDTNLSSVEPQGSSTIADRDNNRSQAAELLLSTDAFASSDREINQKSITSLDGLSQVVLPALQEESSTSSQFVMSQGGSICHPSSNNHSLIGRPFRHRVLWNHDQLLQLESWYRTDRYPAGHTMRQYADTLASMCPAGPNPTRQNVDYWFQNRRRKDSHPEVMQQREKKKMAKTLWGQILDQRAQSGT